MKESGLPVSQLERSEFRTHTRMPKDRYTIPKMGTKTAEIRDTLIQPGGALIEDMTYLFKFRKYPKCRVHAVLLYLEDMCGYCIVGKDIDKGRIRAGRNRYRYRITALMNWDGSVKEDYIAEEV